jgi:hypothetical protein
MIIVKYQQSLSDAAAAAYLTAKMAVVECEKKLLKEAKHTKLNHLPPV